MFNINITIILLLIIHFKEAKLNDEHDKCSKNLDNHVCEITGTFHRPHPVEYHINCDQHIGTDYYAFNVRFSKVPKIIWNGCHAFLDHPALEYINDRESVLNLIITRFTNITLISDHFKPFKSLLNFTLINNINVYFENSTFDSLFNLNYLEFNNNTIVDNSTLKLNLINLKYFIINEPNLIIDNIIVDANLTNLLNITINSGKKLDAIKLLKVLPTAIEVLSLNNVLITSQTGLNFQNFTNLKFLQITHTNASEIYFYKSILDSLTFLNVSGNNLSAINFNKSEFNRLEILDLSKNMLKELNENEFLNMPLLKYLNLSHNYIESVNQNAFLTNKKLLELNLQDNNLKQLPLQNYVNNLKGLTIKVDRNNFNCAWLDSLKSNALLFKKFKFTPEINAVNINGLKCTYSSHSIGEPPVNNITVDDKRSVLQLNYLIIIISIILIVCLTIIINVILTYYKRYRKTKRMPFYRLLNRDRCGQSTESTQSILFNRKLPATQYETPINSNCSNSDDLDRGSMHNNLYEEITSNTTPVSRDAPFNQFSDTSF